MSTLLIRLMPINLVCTLLIFTAFSGIIQSHSLVLGQTFQQQKTISKNTRSHTILTNSSSDTTFVLKIENDKRVVDGALKTKLTREVKAAIAKYQLKKPYKIAMGFTKGARDVETFLFGEQIFYTLAESGFSITGTPLDMPEEAPNAIPQIKVINNTIYVVLSKM
ncbi:hypothetical protein [Emticicia agri]|uniref:Uncharacterized protein n=1 Tax=Emticicia agri TaxID=2492393 RepID=A0A4V1ZDV5_9BACT|nr:hypothetical protein [Emticicia agri]RYU97480.1 hypothetical protein EWM59_01970 [Emticicia agri]